MEKKKVTATVISQKKLAEGIFDLTLETKLAGEAKAGQFVSVYTNDASKLLPRPISICMADETAGTIRLVYRVAGKGTALFSELSAGDKIKILGVLGNGFPLDKADGKTALLMGGGIGIPPMLQTAAALKKRGMAADVKAVLGYRSELFLFDEFKKECETFAATEDGSFGTAGNVMDAVKAEGIKADVIFACGPAPMLRAIKEYALSNGITAYISLEERMACGVGACLGCVCKTTDTDHHSNVKNSRICTDGPVYDAKDVQI